MGSHGQRKVKGMPSQREKVCGSHEYIVQHGVVAGNPCGHGDKQHV